MGGAGWPAVGEANHAKAAMVRAAAAMRRAGLRKR